MSVSRSFGDPEAKISSLGGNPEVLLAVPDIKSFKIKKDTDFMIIGCDGIFDRLNNCDVLHSIWSMCNENFFGKDINEHCGKIADIIIRNCLASGANDNLTCIFVCFENFKNLLYNNENNNSYNNGNVNVNVILNNLRNITEETFCESTDESNFNNNNNDNMDRNQRNSMSSNNNISNMNNNPNNGNNNHSQNNPEKISRSKSESKNLPSAKGQRKDRKFHMTLSQHNNFEPNSTKLTSPGKPKVLSPINGKAINKYFSPTNTSLKNFNATLINSGMSNQMLNHTGSNLNSIEEHMHTKNKFNKSTVVNNKLDLISPKNSEGNKKLNIRNAHDDKFKSLPAINLNMSLKNKN